MGTTLGEALRIIERRRKILEVYSPSPDRGAEVANQFSTQNVVVRYELLPAEGGIDFVIVRDGDGSFLGSLGLDTFDAMLSPEIHPPWVLAESDTALDEVFDFLDNTLFSSFDRRQMLATAREIEERAWRKGSGTLYTGFQNAAALRAQTDVYEQLAERTQLSIQLYLSDAWTVDLSDWITVHVNSAKEIGDFWFVIFDGNGVDIDKCGLVAEEREPGRYYGFWTYDPDIVDELVSYLEAQYDAS